MNFGTTEKPRFISIILQITPYTQYLWKWWGFPDFKTYFHTFPIPGPTFYFWFDSITWYAITNRISKKWSSDGKVLQIMKNVSDLFITTRQMFLRLKYLVFPFFIIVHVFLLQYSGELYFLKLPIVLFYLFIYLFSFLFIIVFFTIVYMQR